MKPKLKLLFIIGITFTILYLIQSAITYAIFHVLISFLEPATFLERCSILAGAYLLGVIVVTGVFRKILFFLRFFRFVDDKMVELIIERSPKKWQKGIRDVLD